MFYLFVLCNFVHGARSLYFSIMKGLSNSNVSFQSHEPCYLNINKSKPKDVHGVRFNIKALLHGAHFHATCLATPLRDKLHGPLHRVTCCAMVKIVARQVAPIVAQNRIGFYFLQRFFFSVASCNTLSATCLAMFP